LAASQDQHALRDVGALQMVGPCIWGFFTGCSDKRTIIFLRCSDNHEITIMRIIFSDIIGCSDNGIRGLFEKLLHA
jgi:hypothetical protein